MLFQLMGDFEFAYKKGIRQLLSSENLWPFILGQQQNRVIDLITQDESMPEFISFLFLEDIRLPYITSELFQTENERIMKCLFGQADEDSGTENPMDDSPQQKKLHIKQLLKFARADYLLVTQAGYIAKAMFAIIRKRGHELWELITADFLSDLLKHIWIKHIAEIVEKLILLDNDDDHEKNIIERQTLLRRVFAILIKRQYDKDIVYNICDLIIEVRKGSNQYLIDETQLYFEDLVTTAHTSMNENFVLLLSTYDVEKFSMDDIVFALKQENTDISPFINSQGKLTHPLGLYKQYWINIVVKIFEKPELHAFDHHIFKQILVLMNKYPYNTQFHIQFEKIVTISLEHDELLKSLVKTKYLEFIIENNNPKSDHDYRTILNNLSVIINNNKDRDIIAQYFIKNQFISIWNNYYDAIQDRIQTEKQFLLGYNPRAPVLDAPKFKPELKFLNNFSLKQQQMKVEKRNEMLQKQNNELQTSTISIRKVNSANENDLNNEFYQIEQEPEPEPEPDYEQEPMAEDEDNVQPFGKQHKEEDEPYPNITTFNYSTYWKLDHSSDFEQKILDQYQ